MKNIAIVLCIGLLAGAPWENTGAHQLTAENAQSRFLNRFLEVTKGKVNQIIENVIEQAEKAITAAEQKGADLNQKLEDETADYQQELDEKDEKILMKVGIELDAIFDQLRDTDVSECEKLADTVRETVIAAIGNQTKCVTEPLETGLTYIKNIHSIAGEIVNEIKDLEEDRLKCTQRSRKLKDIIRAIICLNKVGIKAVLITAKRVPEITDNAVKLHFLVKNLRYTVPRCIVDSGAAVILDNIEDLINGVKECVREAKNKEGILQVM